MQISLNNTGKRFNREWIFRHFSYEFAAPKKYAITGSNGSGKSTLLQVIAGSLTFNEGSISITNEEQQTNDELGANNEQRETNNKKRETRNEERETNNEERETNNEKLYKSISIAAPYLELIEEMTANEFLTFHTQFKSFSISIEEGLQIVSLQKAANKQIRYYSSGMKQRLKLAQAFFCSSPILLLDEPTTNLDADGIALYHQLIHNYTSNKLVIISSNDKQEYDFCEEVIEIGQYK
jgi:ABC-type multidrug transport system ATPase subunit